MSEHAAELKKRERDPLFDNMKAILIFLVVLGHCVSSFNDIGGPLYSWLYSVIFSFHMPAFLFVSGYFASPDPKRTIRRLLPLYLVFQTAHIFLKYLEEWSADPETARIEFQIFDPQWTLWYLMVLMIFALVLPVFAVDKPGKQIRNLVIAFACGLLIGMNDEMHNFMDISRAISFLPFFLMGYYTKCNQHLISWITAPRQNPDRNFLMVITKLTAVVSAAILLICFSLPGCPYRGEMFYGTMSYRADGFTVGIKIQTYLISSAWILILLFLVPNRRLPLLGKIGRNTLGVYLFHTIAIRLLRVNPAVDTVINSSFALMLAVAAGLTLLLSRDCFSNLLRKIQNIHVSGVPRKAKAAAEAAAEPEGQTAVGRTHTAD